MKLFRKIKGASLAEYAILTGLIAVVVLFFVGQLGYQVSDIFGVTQSTLKEKREASLSSTAPPPGEVAAATPSVPLSDFRDNTYDCSTDPDCGTYYTNDSGWHDLSTEAPELTAFRMLMDTPNAGNLGPYIDASAQPADQTLVYDTTDGAIVGWAGGAGFDTLVLSQIGCADLYFQWGYDPGSVVIQEVVNAGDPHTIDFEALDVDGLYCAADDSYYSFTDIQDALGPQQSTPPQPTYADLTPELQAAISETDFNDPNFDMNALPQSVQDDLTAFLDDWFNASGPSGPPSVVYVSDLPSAQTADQVDSGTGGTTGGSGDTGGNLGYDPVMCDDPDYAAAHIECPQ